MNLMSWQQFPRLYTDRLILREITLMDAEDIFRIYSDKEVMRYWGAPPHISIQQTQLMIEGIAESYQSHEGVRWGIVLKSSGKLIGSCGHWRLIRQHYRSEIGYELSRAYWGNGIMAEALEPIVQYGFHEMGLHSIEAQVDPDNVRSARLLEKLNFRREGYLRESYYREGRFLDTLLYARLCTD